jgi:hypothetical protein
MIPLRRRALSLSELDLSARGLSAEDALEDLDAAEFKAAARLRPNQPDPSSDIKISCPAGQDYWHAGATTLTVRQVRTERPLHAMATSKNRTRVMGQHLPSRRTLPIAVKISLNLRMYN